MAETCSCTLLIVNVL